MRFRRNAEPALYYSYPPSPHLAKSLSFSLIFNFTGCRGMEWVQLQSRLSLLKWFPGSQKSCAHAILSPHPALWSTYTPPLPPEGVWNGCYKESFKRSFNSRKNSFVNLFQSCPIKFKCDRNKGISPQISFNQINLPINVETIDDFDIIFVNDFLI